MASTITPTQTRVNDPYQQTIFQYNTADSKIYLSRESNKLLNVIGTDMVLKGMAMLAPSIIGLSTIRTNIDIGWAIQDSTLIQFTDSNNVDIDVSSLDDTPVGGAHLGVFLKYQYLQTIEANLASVDIFHIQYDGTVTNPSARFSSNSCRILLGVIDFTKSGTTVVSATINTNLSTLNVEGSIMYQRGANIDNMNLANIFSLAFKDDREYLLKRDFLLME